jgi:hypothetical protein
MKTNSIDLMFQIGKINSLDNTIGNTDKLIENYRNLHYFKYKFQLLFEKVKYYINLENTILDINKV